MQFITYIQGSDKIPALVLCIVIAAALFGFTLCVLSIAGVFLLQICFPGKDITMKQKCHNFSSHAVYTVCDLSFL